MSFSVSRFKSFSMIGVYDLKDSFPLNYPRSFILNSHGRVHRGHIGIMKQKMQTTIL